MRPLVLLWSCLVLPGYGAMVGPDEIVGFEGDTVSLQCTYREELRKNKKYWCRKSGLLIPYCSGTIYTEDGQERTKGRVSIQDNPQELTLNVTLRNLTRQDTGKYWCGVSILGFDETFLVSLVVLQGPCCPSPTPSFQPLATTSLQPKATAWHTQLPQLRPSSDEHAGTSLYTGTAPHAGSSPHTVTSLKDETSPHEATSPHAGASQPATHLDSASTEDKGLVRSSKSSTSLPMVRILAPVLVLLTLLLATGLAALGRYMLQWRKKVQPVAVAETQRNEKVHFSPLPLKNGHVPEYAVIDLAARSRPHASPKPSCREIQCLSQDTECDSSPGPPLHMSEEEPSLSKFISV